MSWKPQFQADSTGRWYDNALRFATKEEAEAQAKEHFNRWLAAKAWQVVESDDPVNYKWENDQLVECR